MKRRVLFIGAVDFSGALLERILRTNCVDVCGIVTKRHSSYNSDHRDLSLAVSPEIPVCYAERGDEKDILSWALQLKPDAIYCFGWSHLLGKNLLNAAPLGCVFKLAYPEHPASDVNHCQETVRKFLESGGNSSEMLNSIEEKFYKMSFTVNMAIV